MELSGNPDGPGLKPPDKKGGHSKSDIPQASGAAFDDVRTDRACSIVDRDLLSGRGLAHDGKKSSNYARDPIRRT